MRARPRHGTEQGGFTLLELTIVASILAILASIGVPQYTAALRTARVGKAKHELRTISNAIDSFTANNQGMLPLTLYQVGFGGKLDPWGLPYCYLNYGDGCGDGLDWAVAAGLVDPSAFAPVDGGAGGGDGGVGAAGLVGAPQRPQGPPPGRAGSIPSAVPSALPSSVPSNAPARVNFERIAGRIGRRLNLIERGAIEDAVQRGGSFSLFTQVPAETTRRRDRYMFPLNTDYDLFSLGPDHRTATSLGESVGLDDVIRANNGGFFGPASEY